MSFSLPPAGLDRHSLDDDILGHQDYEDMKQVYRGGRGRGRRDEDVSMPLWMPLTEPVAPSKPVTEAPAWLPLNDPAPTGRKPSRERMPSFNPPVQRATSPAALQRHTSFSDRSPELIPSHYPLSNSSNDLDELDELEDTYHDQLSHSYSSSSAFPTGDAMEDSVHINDPSASPYLPSSNPLSPSMESSGELPPKVLMAEDYFNLNERMKKKKKAAMSFSELRSAIEVMHDESRLQNEEELENWELETDMMQRLHDASW